MRSNIILIAGPTASGKSNFAVNLAKKINGEIINADSMQVYKQLKILTARPNKKDQIIAHLVWGPRRRCLGVPWAVTIDHQSLDDGTVTIRRRDDQRQVRADVDALIEGIASGSLQSLF